jgi:hypothetical protein
MKDGAKDRHPLASYEEIEEAYLAIMADQYVVLEDDRKGGKVQFVDYAISHKGIVVYDGKMSSNFKSYLDLTQTAETHCRFLEKVVSVLDDAHSDRLWETSGLDRRLALSVRVDGEPYDLQEHFFFLDENSDTWQLEKLDDNVKAAIIKLTEMVKAHDPYFDFTSALEGYTWMKDDLKERGVECGYLAKERTDEFGPLPKGWESTKNGMAANGDPVFGGIIDRELISQGEQIIYGQWFVVANENTANESLKNARYDERTFAFKALEEELERVIGKNFGYELGF